MQTTLRIHRLLACILTVLVLPGCMTKGINNEIPITQPPLLDTANDKSMGLIADDFAHAMQQIPSLAPASTTVQLLRKQLHDRLIQAFKNSLELAGYGVRWVDEPAGNLLQYRREDVSAVGIPDQLRLDVAVGDVELRRSYTGLIANQVQPVTPLYVRCCVGRCPVFYKYQSPTPKGRTSVSA
jgi:hypothetical protein